MRGNKDDAVAMYLRIPTETTPAMKRGIDFDRHVEEFVKKNKMLPPELGGKIVFTNPVTKLTLTGEYNEQFDIKGEFDIYDDPVIAEVKCSSVRDSGDYAEDFQVSLYFLLAELCKKNADRAWILRYDPTRRLYDSSLIWKSQRRIEQVKKIIDEHGPEIYTYFQEQGVL